MDKVRAIEASALAQQNAMNSAISRGESEIQKFYKNSAVFLTGGSGFLGKQLIEKLMRSCQISKMFILLRPKKGKQIQERLADILKDSVFDTLRKQKPDFSDKIIAVDGDVAEIRLGIKSEDWKTLTEEVNVIFHVAATTKFDETLRLATLINVRGTREALSLGRACQNLRSYVHVSTAYAHATTNLIGHNIEEEFYNAPVPPETMISMVENMEPERLENITKDLIKNWPNTYTFSKSISEELVRTSSAGLPICIVRPGIVLSSYREPSPGWLDTSCIYGASGIIFGVALGVLHTVYTKFETTLGIVPCDYVNNAIIVAGRETATNQAKGGNHTRIYTVTSVHRNPATWATLSKIIWTEGTKIPSPKSIYYSFLVETTSKFLYTILSLIYHLIPAYIADFICLLFGKKRRFVKMVNRVNKMTRTLSYFMTNEWQFVDNNLDKLFSCLSTADKTIFQFDVFDINWASFAVMWCVGIRKHLFKDGLKGTEYAVKKQRFLKIAHYLFMMFYAYCIWKLAYFVFYIMSSIFQAVN